VVVQVQSLWPVKQLVHHHGARPRADSLCGSFRDTILKVCTNTTVVDLLFAQFNILVELVRAERLIVTSVAFDSETLMFGHPLKRVLRLNSFA